MANSPEEPAGGPPPQVDKVPLGELIESSPAVPASKPPKTARRRRKEDLDRAKHITERLRLTNERRKLEVERGKSQLVRDEKDHEKIWFFRRVFAIVGVMIAVLWQFAILCVVCYQGLGILNVPTPVLLALVSTTTVNIIGILVIVFKFVFAPSSQEAARKGNDE